MDSVEIISPECRRDERGFVLWPLPERCFEPDGPGNLHVPSIAPGSVRGNHYHAMATEYLYVLSGPCRAVFLHRATGETLETVFSEGLPLLIKIAPDTVHAFQNIGETAIHLLCYEHPALPPEAGDIHRHILLA